MLTPTTCLGAQFATGSSACWTTPVWVVRSDDGTRLACDRHVHGAIDRERGSLVLPVAAAPVDTMSASRDAIRLNYYGGTS
jgi:hypothetical protein